MHYINRNRAKSTGPSKFDAGWQDPFQYYCLDDPALEETLAGKVYKDLKKDRSMSMDHINIQTFHFPSDRVISPSIQNNTEEISANTENPSWLQKIITFFKRLFSCFFHSRS